MKTHQDKMRREREKKGERRDNIIAVDQNISLRDVEYSYPLRGDQTHFGPYNFSLEQGQTVCIKSASHLHKHSSGKRYTPSSKPGSKHTYHGVRQIWFVGHNAIH